MIIEPNEFIYDKSYKIIFVCGDNSFLVSYIMNKLEKYIEPFLQYDFIYGVEPKHSGKSIIRNLDIWKNIKHKKENIYIPCYNWNIKSSKSILEKRYSDIIIEYIHEYCSYEMLEIIDSLNEKEICKIVTNTKQKSNNIYEKIINSILQ